VLNGRLPLPAEVAERITQALRSTRVETAAAGWARGLQVSSESTKALMMEEWGDEWDDKTLAAEAAWSKLPPTEQREWTRLKLRYHPNVWRLLADVGSRIKTKGVSR
jgi:hypothetical protein